MIPRELQTALILTLVTSVIAPLILLFINRMVNKPSNDVDMTKKALEAASDAVDQLNDAREDLKKRDAAHEAEIASLNLEICRLKATVTGQYEVHLKILTGTNPAILEQSIILVPETITETRYGKEQPDGG